MTEEQIERGRWWAQRIIRSTYDFVDDWQRENAKHWLGAVKRGIPSAKVQSLFIANVRRFKNGRTSNIPDDYVAIDDGDSV